MPEVLLSGPPRAHPRLAPASRRERDHQIPPAGPVGAPSRRRRPSRGRPTALSAPTSNEVCDERDSGARAGADRGSAPRTGPIPEFAPGRHGAGQRQGGRGHARARPGVRGRVHRAQEPRHQLGLHRAQDQLRRGRGARSSRCTARRSPRSRWCAAAACAGPSCIICAAAPARRRASPSARDDAAGGGKPRQREPATTRPIGGRASGAAAGRTRTSEGG